MPPTKSKLRKTVSGPASTVATFVQDSTEGAGDRAGPRWDNPSISLEENLRRVAAGEGSNALFWREEVRPNILRLARHSHALRAWKRLEKEFGTDRSELGQTIQDLFSVARIARQETWERRTAAELRDYAKRTAGACNELIRLIHVDPYLINIQYTDYMPPSDAAVEYVGKVDSNPPPFNPQMYQYFLNLERDNEVRRPYTQGRSSFGTVQSTSFSDHLLELLNRLKMYASSVKREPVSARPREAQAEVRVCALRMCKVIKASRQDADTNVIVADLLSVLFAQKIEPKHVSRWWAKRPDSYR